MGIAQEALNALEQATPVGPETWSKASEVAARKSLELAGALYPHLGQSQKRHMDKAIDRLRWNAQVFWGKPLPFDRFLPHRDFGFRLVRSSEVARVQSELREEADPSGARDIFLDAWREAWSKSEISRALEKAPAAEGRLTMPYSTYFDTAFFKTIWGCFGDVIAEDAELDVGFLEEPSPWEGYHAVFASGKANCGIHNYAVLLQDADPALEDLNLVLAFPLFEYFGFGVFAGTDTWLRAIDSGQLKLDQKTWNIVIGESRQEAGEAVARAVFETAETFVPLGAADLEALLRRLLRALRGEGHEHLARPANLVGGLEAFLNGQTDVVCCGQTEFYYLDRGPERHAARCVLRPTELGRFFPNKLKGLVPPLHRPLDGLVCPAEVVETHTWALRRFLAAWFVARSTWEALTKRSGEDGRRMREIVGRYVTAEFNSLHASYPLFSWEDAWDVFSDGYADHYYPTPHIAFQALTDKRHGQGYFNVVRAETRFSSFEGQVEDLHALDFLEGTMTWIYGESRWRRGGLTLVRAKT